MSGRSESGSASIYVLAGALLVGLAAIVPLATVTTAVARQRAAVAADAAALAGARSLAQTGSTATACLRAVTLAVANGARIDSCRAVACPPPGSPSLQVAATVVVAFARFAGEVSASARAGPAGCLANRLSPGDARRSLGTRVAAPPQP